MQKFRNVFLKFKIGNHVIIGKLKKVFKDPTDNYYAGAEWIAKKGLSGLRFKFSKRMTTWFEDPVLPDVIKEGMVIPIEGYDIDGRRMFTSPMHKDVMLKRIMMEMNRQLIIEKSISRSLQKDTESRITDNITMQEAWNRAMSTRAGMFNDSYSREMIKEPREDEEIEVET